MVAIPISFDDLDPGECFAFAKLAALIHDGLSPQSEQDKFDRVVVAAIDRGLDLDVNKWFRLWLVTTRARPICLVTKADAAGKTALAAAGNVIKRELDGDDISGDEWSQVRALAAKALVAADRAMHVAPPTRKSRATLAEAWAAANAAYAVVDPAVQSLKAAAVFAVLGSTVKTMADLDPSTISREEALAALGRVDAVAYKVMAAKLMNLLKSTT